MSGGVSFSVLGADLGSVSLVRGTSVFVWYRKEESPSYLQVSTDI